MSVPSLPADARSAAKYLLENFKLFPIRVDARSKAPSYSDWEKTRLSTPAEVDQHFDVDPSCTNLGILWGCGNNMVDVDLDSDVAIKLGPQFLPETSMIFGRKSARASHWIYHGSGVLSKQFIDPVIEAENKALEKEKRKKAMLVEIRGTGGQTVFPPSVHPSDEAITFAKLDAPADVDIATLEWAVRCLASCTLLARYWPGVGARNHALMYLIGYLAKFWTDDEIRRFVGSLYSAVSEPGDIRQEMEAQIKGARTKLNRKPVGGAPKLKEYIDPRVIDKVVDWLSLDESLGPEDIKPFEEYDEMPDPIYIVDRFINEGTTEIWVADSGSGKSTLATALANAVAHGEPFCGLKTTKRPVMLIDGGENPKPVMRHRLALLGIKQRGDPDRVILWGDWCEQTPTVPNEQITKWVEACEGAKPLIVIDSLGKFFSGKSENDNAEMHKFMALLADWERLGASLLILHNMGRNQTYRGASAILDSCDAMRELTARFENKLIVSIVVKTTKERVRRDDALDSTFALKFTNGQFILMNNLPPTEQQISLNGELARLLVDHPNVTVLEFHKAAKDEGLRLGQKKVHDWLKYNVRVGGAVIESKEGKKLVYSYRGAPPPQTEDTPF